MIDALAKFSSAFFLSSWLLSQVFRVAKQHRTDDHFTTIQTNLASLLEQIESRTNHLLSNITGGDSYCFLMFLELNRLRKHSDELGKATLLLQRLGQYPISELSIWIVDRDLELPEGAGVGDIAKRGKHIEIGGFARRRKVLTQSLTFDASSNEKCFDIYLSAMNGTIHQKIWVQRIEGQWLVASRVEKDGIVLLDSVDSSFPRTDDGDVAWW
ncbi:hypothetical protein ASC94_09295 [Massilia sp. Root418]|nr:hypothetical protein ASC94_09295 [Massilia sp. Root418]